MAEDKGSKTEQATPRRREKAREEGQVATSRDLTAGLALLGAGLAARMMWNSSWAQITKTGTWTLTHAASNDLSTGGIAQIAGQWLGLTQRWAGARSARRSVWRRISADEVHVRQPPSRSWRSSNDQRVQEAGLDPRAVEAAKSTLKWLIMGTMLWILWGRMQTW